MKIALQYICRYCIVILLTGIVLIAALPQVSAEEYHIQSNNRDEVYDISLEWVKSFGSKDWTTFKLWDDGTSSHCYISFKLNSGAKVNIPASLHLNHPTSIEPSQQFSIKTTLNFDGTKELTLTSEFFIKIDLDLPGPISYIRQLGWVDDIENVYGGAWECTFNLNAQTINSLMNKIYLGDENTLQSFYTHLQINNVITVENLDLNSQTLGNLASGKIRVDILRAILIAAKQLSESTPVSAAIYALDWLLTNVIKTSAGIILTPKVSAQLTSNVNSMPGINLDTSQLVFNGDISSKQIGSTVSDSIKEASYGSNILNINYNPIEYKFLFDTDWDYYLNIDFDFLKFDMYNKNCQFDLGTFPSLTSDVGIVSKQVNCSFKLDEPLQATTPTDNKGEVKIELADSSGLSNVKLFYSEDKIAWQELKMLTQGTDYTTKPIASVSKDTTVYYYFEVTDGDNDLYRIDNHGAYYTYSLRPESIFPLNITTIIALVAVVLIIILTCSIVIIIRERKGMHVNFQGNSYPLLI